MKRKKLSSLFLLLIIPFYGYAELPKLSYKLYGFVENQISINSRRNVETVGISFNIMPYPEKPDANGKDLNAVSSAELLAINSRVGLDVSGLELFKSKISAKIEADFAGAGTSYYVLRLRRAFIDMNWEKIQLLVGQDWHPMSICVMPASLELNGGAPFNPFNRSPQVNFKYKMGNWKWTAAALYEMQFCSDGPAGKNAIYMRDAIMPDFFLGADNACEHFRWGIGADVKMIAPRTQSTVQTVDGPKTYVVDENLTTLSYMAYGQYEKDKLSIKAKAIFGQNLTDMTMVGMYGVSSRDEATGKQEYAGFNIATAWLNVVYGKSWKVGLYAGYTANLGTNKDLIADTPVYGYGYVENQIIDQMYRIMPQITYSRQNWKIGMEAGITTAGYGTLDIETGKAKDVKNVTGFRGLLALSYSF